MCLARYVANATEVHTLTRLADNVRTFFTQPAHDLFGPADQTEPPEPPSLTPETCAARASALLSGEAGSNQPWTEATACAVTGLLLLQLRQENRVWEVEER